MIKNFTLILISLVFLSACGGGGGGSSDGGSSSGLRIIHAAIDAPPVELRSSLSPTTIYQTSAFALPIRYANVPKGEQKIEMIRAKSSSSVVSSVLVNYAGGKKSILLFGSYEDGGVQSVSFDDPTPQLEGEAAIRIVNGLQNSPAIVVNVAGKTSSSARYGSAGEYMGIAPGVHSFSVSSGNTVIDTGTIEVQAGRSYTLLSAGRMFYFAASSLYQD